MELQLMFNYLHAVAIFHGNRKIINKYSVKTSLTIVLYLK